MRSRLFAPILLAVCALGVCAAPALGAPAPAPGWGLFSFASPSNLPPGGVGVIQLDITNNGAEASAGPVTVSDTLPPGTSAIKVGGFGDKERSVPFEPLPIPLLGSNVFSAGEEEVWYGGARWVCAGNGNGGGVAGATTVTCTSNPGFMPSIPPAIEQEHFEGRRRIAERLGIEVQVNTGLGPETAQNQASIEGGGAPIPTSVSNPVTISAQEPAFGFPDWDVWFTNANGTPDTQAGSHPYEATFALRLAERATQQKESYLADGYVRNIEARLPPGFFGQPNAVPECTRTQLNAKECPADTQIGIVGAGNEGENGGQSGYIETPVYNMVPPKGVPDELAGSINGVSAFFDAGVRSAHGYAIVEHVDNLPLAAKIDATILTLWGVPAEASHDAQRRSDPNCENGCSSGLTPKPFLTLPTSCAGPQAFTIVGQGTWTDPAASAEATAETPTGFTGCEDLSIEPTLSAVPETAFADTPSGLIAEVQIPQENLTNPEGVVAATLENTTVTLPEGLVINPGQAAGLQACGEAEANIHGEGPPSCPKASKVGTVKIQTPLLEGELESELEGEVFVLQSNPPELRLLIAVSADGIYLKLPGTVHLDTQTGQLTTTFDETPELPFTSFKLAFSGGAQAALDTPTQCGTYTTSWNFTPWTSPLGAEVPGSDSFLVSSGPNGSPCPSTPLPFSPELIAGSTTDQAGGFTNFSLLLQRGDGQQRIERLQFRAPDGLGGMLSTVPLCPEPQAGEGECPAASQIGHASVASGPGPYPLVIPQPGDPEIPIYLTGPYEGAPFGLSIVTHVIAGPFDLGTIITRAKVEVDPYTAQITVTTDPLPQVVAGVPTDLRLVDSVIDRPGFIFNPTDCEPSSFSGTAWGTPPPGAPGPGASASIASRFQVGSCRQLAFTPKFSVTTSAKTSRVDGADLVAKVTNPPAAQGTRADIAMVKVELPAQLPSRLATLRKACTAAQFETNPAGCPAASLVGHAVVHTPELPVPLEGPAIFVSHGGEAWPSLVIVLQGDNVTIDLVGTTFISKADVTSTTFKAVPDAPFSSFELTLPEGPYSALAADGNLCDPTHPVTVKRRTTIEIHGHRRIVIRKVNETKSTRLVMPNEFVAQNGAVIHQNTTITVTGCPRAKAAKRTGKRKK
ncbi:MAG TPA: hypothetical protein VG147_05135 [Solirubrobacteraceae bacterium]|jgi:hypothetical protein|nr:hypothetical protein [Solirubrobacteraceae bacterium]